MVFMSGNGLENFRKGYLTLTPFLPAEILLAIVNTMVLQSIGQKRLCQQLKSRKNSNIMHINAGILWWFITVKHLYNVTLYNIIFTIQHKFAGYRSVSIKIPSLQCITEYSLNDANRKLRELIFIFFFIDNRFIINGFLPCVSQFGDQDTVFCMNRFL